MGEEGLYGPAPIFVEGPLAPMTCFEQRQSTKRLDNFLPLSPDSEGGPVLALQGTTPEGYEVGSIRVTGYSWNPTEFDHLKTGDEIDRHSNKYKFHLYWLQDGRCSACQRVMYLDHMEMDRIVPGDDGPWIHLWKRSAPLLFLQQD